MLAWSPPCLTIPGSTSHPLDVPAPCCSLLGRCALRALLGSQSQKITWREISSQMHSFQLKATEILQTSLSRGLYGECYNLLSVSLCFIVFAFTDTCLIFSQLCWLHAFTWCCNRYYRHLCMTSPTTWFYFSFFEVLLIVYGSLRDSDLPSIEATACKLKAVPSNRLLLFMR